MKKNSKILFTLLIASMLLILVNPIQVSAATTNTIVDIPDKTLRSEILNTLNKSENDNITVNDMESITSLSISGVSNEKISSLEGINYCTNLTDLSLEGTNVTDLSPLSNLSNLRTLYLNTNEISDISALNNLSSLYNLTLSDNEISPLSNLTYLRLLELNNQKVYFNVDFSSNTINLENPTKGLTPTSPTVIYDINCNGTYNANTNSLTCTNISKDSNLSFKFVSNVTLGRANCIFSGVACNR